MKKEIQACVLVVMLLGLTGCSLRMKQEQVAGTENVSNSFQSVTETSEAGQVRNEEKLGFDSKSNIETEKIESSEIEQTESEEIYDFDRMDISPNAGCYMIPEAEWKSEIRNNKETVYNTQILDLYAQVLRGEKPFLYRGDYWAEQKMDRESYINWFKSDDTENGYYCFPDGRISFFDSNVEDDSFEICMRVGYTHDTEDKGKQNESFDGGYLILRYYDGFIYGYGHGFRSIFNLKKDGVTWGANGAGSGSIWRICFDGVAELGGDIAKWDDGLNENMDENYVKVTREELKEKNSDYAFGDENEVEWHDFTSGEWETALYQYNNE